MWRATEHVEAILGVLSPNYGLSKLQSYQTQEIADLRPDIDYELLYARSLSWARRHGFALGITGSVDEWRYRSGAEGDAAVSLNLQAIDINSGEVLWSASGVRCGWGRETLKGTAQKLLRDLLATMQIRNKK
jgi:polysaccharide biosynthesis protein PelC